MIDPRETSHPAHDAPEIVVVTDDRSDKSPRLATASRVRPRLGVGHLLVWVGCCGVFLGLARSLTEHPSGTLGAIFLTLVAAGYGAAWTGLVITLVRTLRGASWSIEPGQWLLAVLGVVEAVEVLGGMASRWVRNPQAINDATALCAFVAPLLDKRLAHHWKWLFAAIAVVYALPLLIMLAGRGDMPDVLVRATEILTPHRLAATAALAALAVALFDHFYVRGRKEERGWLHWTGIATALWLSLLPTAASWLFSG
ncbi:MAG TPA: hypothetical protein VG826_06745 [Pirellulales bacterium]|nr:hypothetical protein [Pirellulales bacterium]